MKTTPKENRFEFVVIASARARQLLRGAEPREAGEKKVTIAQREVRSQRPRPNSRIAMSDERWADLGCRIVGGSGG